MLPELLSGEMPPPSRFSALPVGDGVADLLASSAAVCRRPFLPRRLSVTFNGSGDDGGGDGGGGDAARSDGGLRNPRARANSSRP